MLEELYKFLSSFGVSAYEENSVPQNAELPYITYQMKLGEFKNIVPLTASIWTRSNSWTQATTILNKINSKLKTGGFQFNNKFWVKKGNPFCYSLADTDDTIKRYIVNLDIEFFE